MAAVLIFLQKKTAAKGSAAQGFSKTREFLTGTLQAEAQTKDHTEG